MDTQNYDSYYKSCYNKFYNELIDRYVNQYEEADDKVYAKGIIYDEVSHARNNTLFMSKGINDKFKLKVIEVYEHVSKMNKNNPVKTFVEKLPEVKTWLYEQLGEYINVEFDENFCNESNEVIIDFIAQYRAALRFESQVLDANSKIVIDNQETESNVSDNSVTGARLDIGEMVYGYKWILEPYEYKFSVFEKSLKEYIASDIIRMVFSPKVELVPKQQCKWLKKGKNRKTNKILLFYFIDLLRTKGIIEIEELGKISDDELDEESDDESVDESKDELIEELLVKKINNIFCDYEGKPFQLLDKSYREFIKKLRNEDTEFIKLQNIIDEIINA